MIPNKVDIVESTRKDYPRAWSKCHMLNDPEAHDFIILCGRRLYDFDKRFGLNGKRGGNDLSWDAINWNEPGAHNVIDVVAGAGSPSATPAWQVTNTTGKWFNPYDFSTYYNYDVVAPDPGEPTPEPNPTPNPPPTNNVEPLLNQLIDLHKSTNTLLNSIIGYIILNNDYIQNVQADKFDQLIAHAENRNVQFDVLMKRLNDRFKIGF